MSRFTTLLLLTVLTLGAAACGGSPKPPAAPTTAEVVTLKDLQNGDRACYVVVTTAKGEEKSIEGDFDLCKGSPKDASALIGKRVSYKTQKAKVLAASCQGDVDCGKSDEVELVVELTAAP